MSDKNSDSQPNNLKQRTVLIGAGVAYLIIAGLIIFFFALSQRSPVQTEPYDEKFDADGSWKVGEGGATHTAITKYGLSPGYIESRLSFHSNLHKNIILPIIQMTLIGRIQADQSLPVLL